ncbi:hypothetical protein VHEMI07251 [[Torrubiella] hemipterigena]|uniref:Uncharacterized protein n=1 Tax=[Torrubiella] hemipterigena TaxID=1531966 RepID=A0A0A1T9T2_9HYPO|nr:hypothetical protein VHEMI07251 [[Torrubiella] hemipterigena]
MLLPIVAASVTDESRTQVIFLVQVLTIVLEFMVGPLAALLLEWIGPCPTLAMSIPIRLLALSFWHLSPIKSSNVTHREQAESVGQSRLSAYHQLQKAIVDLMHYVRYDMGTIFTNRSVIVDLVAMLIAKVGRPIEDLMAQFLSAKFKWPISKTNMLLSIGTAAQIPWYLVALPALSGWLQRHKGDAIQANRALAIILVSFLWLGILARGLAPTINLFIVGEYPEASIAW